VVSLSTRSVCPSNSSGEPGLSVEISFVFRQPGVVEFVDPASRAIESTIPDSIVDDATTEAVAVTTFFSTPPA
jgi:hypothetical protein